MEYVEIGHDAKRSHRSLQPAVLAQERQSITSTKRGH